MYTIEIETSCKKIHFENKFFKQSYIFHQYSNFQKHDRVEATYCDHG